MERVFITGQTAKDGKGFEETAKALRMDSMLKILGKVIEGSWLATETGEGLISSITGISIKDNGKMGRKKDEECLNGQMEIDI